MFTEYRCKSSLWDWVGVELAMESIVVLVYDAPWWLEPLRLLLINYQCLSTQRTTSIERSSRFWMKVLTVRVHQLTSTSIDIVLITEYSTEDAKVY